MLVWRISEFADLTGYGGTVADGRWNTRGQPVIYAAETSALALLEVLVRARLGKPPADYQLLMIEIEQEVGRVEYPEATPPVLAKSMQWGDAWLADGAAALARVPSAIAPYSFNVLINPLHADIDRIRIVAASRWPWDRRLFR